MNFIQKKLSETINNNDLVLDLGCGDKLYSVYGKTITVDVWDKINPDYLLNLEIEKLPFGENTFDYILMIDFIEHLDKDKGQILLDDCKKIVKNKIFLYTPLIFDNNSKWVNNINSWSYGNEFDYHKSLWTLDDFNDWTRVDSIDHEKFFGYWDKLR